MKIIKKILIVLLVVFIAIQFYRPVKNNATYREVSAFENDTKPTPKIRAILENNCYDCHSSKTVYPWYSQIAPFSYWLNDHVIEGNEHFNISEWDSYSQKKKDHKLDEFIEEIEENKMPLDSYTWLHGNLTSEEKSELIIWANQAKQNLQKQ